MDDILKRVFEEDCSESQRHILLDVAGLDYNTAFECWRHQYKKELVLNPRFRLCHIEEAPSRIEAAGNSANSDYIVVTAECRPDWISENEIRIMSKVGGICIEQHNGALMWTGSIILRIEFRDDPLLASEYLEIMSYIHKQAEPSGG